jgi:intron-binding protein aquarius
MSHAFRKTLSNTEDGRPTIKELHGDGPFTKAAQRWWLREKPAKFNPEILKTEFYDPLEHGKFGFKSLLILENLQFLEK